MNTVELKNMVSLKVFQEAFKYLTDVVDKTVQSLQPEDLKNVFRILSEAQNNGNTVITDGKGRSKQSILLMEDCLEQNGFPIILPTSNANLRPWKKGDVLIVNSGSGTASPLKHAIEAKKAGLKVTGMTYNSELQDRFPDILVLEPSKSKNKLYAPLGTEFELSSAVIGTCIAYSLRDSCEQSIDDFHDSTQKILDLFRNTYDYLEDNLEMLIGFINLISKYIPVSNEHKIFFRGVGRDAIINKVAAIRYGHLHKEPDKDLQVIYEHHWDLRNEGDLAIITSGSGETTQTLNYATQAFISGMKIIGITSFKGSDLGRFSNRVNGCLVLPGRQHQYSQYNMPLKMRKKYLPCFELNCYLTLDALLAQIACNEGISEQDMRASHRPKFLE